jgi:hypothetical protein
MSFTLQGHPIHTLTLHVPARGPWVVDAQLDQAPPELLFSGDHVTLKIDEAELSGTVIESARIGLSLGARVAAGGGGWSKYLARRGYHNDASIKARTLAEDAAREAGETLGTFEPSRATVGADFARNVAPAAAYIEHAAGDAAWWVDYAGITHVGARSVSTVPAEAYTLIAYDPVQRIATLAVRAFAELVPGRTLVGETHEPLTIGDIELVSEKGQPLRATVWAAPKPGAGSRLAGLFSAIITRHTDRELHGVYRYRVVATRGDLRVDLQAVRASSGLPDLQAVQQCPGLPGLAAELTDGAEVLVSFVDGDRAQPLITHYAGPGSNGFVAVGVVLGGEDGAPAARQGDAVRVLLPPASFVGTVGPAPATGIITFLSPTADGVIMAGSSKVRIAT